MLNVADFKEEAMMAGFDPVTVGLDGLMWVFGAIVSRKEIEKTWVCSDLSVGAPKCQKLHMAS